MSASQELYVEAIKTVTQWTIIEQLLKQYLRELIYQEASL